MKGWRMNMTEKEGFEVWIKDMPEHMALPLLAEWHAACAWQRQQDAEICKNQATTNAPYSNFDWNTAVAQCRSAILNQGKQENEHD
jgi:hypothetical protein